MKKSFSPLICLFCLTVILSVARAEEASTVKKLFLKGEYAAAKMEGMRLLQSRWRGQNADETYYLAGLSALKAGDDASAEALFAVVLKDFRRSRLADEARVGLADAYYLKGDRQGAKTRYESFLASRPGSKLKAGVYYRLYLLLKGQGRRAEADSYKEKLRSEFPRSPEASLEKDIFPVRQWPKLEQKSQDVEPLIIMPAIPQVYSIQVGAFSKGSNADRLCQQLIKQGFPAYVEQVIPGAGKDKVIFKVKVGRVDTFPEVKQIERKLSAAGYPTKIIYP
ncbi:MAG: SPOR domain-containing protein [Deltaproteobacteria bacterium]